MPLGFVGASCRLPRNPEALNSGFNLGRVRGPWRMPLRFVGASCRLPRTPEALNSGFNLGRVRGCKSVSVLFGAICFALCAGLVLITSCSQGAAPVACDLTGCAAVRLPVEDTGHSAIAGAIASQSDLEIIGVKCAECPLVSATLTFWKTMSLVTDAPTATAIVAGATPAATVHADKRYEQPLEAGWYLVCADGSCVGVEVLSDHPTTVHVMRGVSPFLFLIFDPGSKIARSPVALSLIPSDDPNADAGPVED
jgi:hypothetical protein